MYKCLYLVIGCMRIIFLTMMKIGDMFAKCDDCPVIESFPVWQITTTFVQQIELTELNKILYSKISL